MKVESFQNSGNLNQWISFNLSHSVVTSTGILPSLQLNKNPERAKPSGFSIRLSLSGINPGINFILIFSSSSASPAVNETAPADFSESWGKL